MSEPKTYMCACGNQFTGRASMIPNGWEWHGSKLLCDDCSTPTPTPKLAKIPPQIVPKGADNGTAIMLRSGSYLDLANIDCRNVQPIDIAAGLRQARFSAQTRQFYTIAQHSVLVLQLVEPVAAEIGGPKGDALRRCALMHDAAEAFIHDITRPLKSQLPDYRRIECELELKLELRFDIRLNRDRHAIVKRADMQALAIEQRDLLGVTHPWPVLTGIDRKPLEAIRITRCWHPDEAEAQFLQAFKDLFPETERMAA